MELLKNKAYVTLLRKLIEDFPDWEKIEGKSILISGASGMLGSLLIDALMLRNEDVSSQRRNRIFATSRRAVAAQERFFRWIDREEFYFFPHDITKALDGFTEKPELLIHAASTTHPAQYAGEPINTILANIFGTKNMLDVAAKTSGSRLLLMSSVEVYGENRGDVDYFDEKYCGYLDCNTLRAGYPEGKRVSESLCQAYIEEKEVDAVIVRLSRCYGPTMRMTDSKALAQFIKKAVVGEDIVLKSEGNQLFSFLYVADAISAMLWTLLRGETGEAYNAADAGSDITLRELARTVADKTGTAVCFEVPEEAERRGYSTATKALLDAEKLKALGWRAHYDLTTGIEETIRILRETNI